MLASDRKAAGQSGALVAAVEAGEVTRERLAHRDSLPVLLVAVGGRLLASVDAFPGNAWAGSPRLPRWHGQARIGQEEARQQTGRSRLAGPCYRR